MLLKVIFAATEGFHQNFEVMFEISIILGLETVYFYNDIKNEKLCGNTKNGLFDHFKRILRENCSKLYSPIWIQLENMDRKHVSNSQKYENVKIRSSV